MKHSRVRARRRRVFRNSGLIGAAVRSLGFLLLVIACVFCLRWISERPNSQHYAQSKNQSFEFTDSTASSGIQARNRRLVYPYSVVPGGVRSADELREIAKHDAVVAAHYSGFDYKRARVIEVDHPRMVYVSYRRRGQIHWTAKQATLHKGEKLLTDGRITARTRCGNQVSALPQADTLPEEPSMAELERPDAVASGTEQLFPKRSALLNLDPVMPLGPGNTSAGLPPGGFIPLPIGGGVGGPVIPPIGGGCPPPNKKKTDTKSSKSSKNCNHSPPPPTVPEPGTMVLVLSGAAAVYARFRLRRA